jgi:hypothetical protein
VEIVPAAASGATKGEIIQWVDLEMADGAIPFGRLSFGLEHLLESIGPAAYEVLVHREYSFGSGALHLDGPSA